MRTLLLSVMLCVSCICVKAQSASPYFYQIFADYGLSSDKTTVSLQDYKGFVWFGTEEGLNRMVDYGVFDIYRFDRTDNRSLSNDHVTMLFEDSQKRFWVGTRDGLNLYDRATKTFSKISLDTEDVKSSTDMIHDLVEDADGDLWVINNQRLILLDGETLEPNDAIEATGREGMALSLNDIELYQTNLWVATSEGLYELRGKKLLSSGVAESSVVSSLLAVKDQLWLGTMGDGLVLYDAVTSTVDLFKETTKDQTLTSNYINDLSLIDEDRIWVATNDGINVLDLEGKFIESYQYDFNSGYSLSDKVVRSLYQDEAGSVWIGTPNSGINYFHKADNLFGYFGQSKENGTEKDLMDYSTFSITSSDDGTSWIGSRKGISRFDPMTSKFQHYPFSGDISNRVSKVMSIAQCSADYLWLGTDNGLVKWMGEGTSYEYVMPEQLNGLEILTVMADEADNLWLGTTTQGVKLYASVSKVLRDIPFEGENSGASGKSEISDIKKYGDRILVATGKGLFRYDNGVLVKVSLSGLAEELPDDIPINAIYQDSHDNILLGTQQDGIVMLNENLLPMHHFKKLDGLASNDIRSLIEDQNGAIWASTANGVSKLSHSTVNKNDIVIRNYDITDGLQGNHFSAQATTITRDGKILMGGLSGLTAFRPEEIIDYQAVQRPTFIGLSVGGEPVKVSDEENGIPKDISMLDELLLNCEQNNFTLSFTALDYQRPDDVVYRYKLLDYDEDWTEVKSDGKAAYQNIPTNRSFDFVFQSKGRLSSEWSQEAKLVISVAPHYYQTFWFKSLIILGGLGLIFFLLWFREKRSVKKQQELETLIDASSSELRKEIGQRQEVERALLEALVIAEEANTIKNNFLANMSHEIRTPLNGIIGLTELSLDGNIAEDQKDNLRTISRSATTLKLIVDDILDIAKIESGKLELSSEPFSVKDLLHDIVTTFNVPAKKKDLTVKYWVLPDVPSFVVGDIRYVRQVLTNLVSNAVKFTHLGGVSIFAEALTENDAEMEIWFTVTDTGIGISEESQEKIFDRFVQNDNSNTREYGGTGLGLSISKELVAKMGGELWVESKEGKGSIFKFYVKTKAFKSETHPLTSEKTKAQISKSNGTARILLVEDNATNQEVALKMLANKGMSVTCVENGQEAVEEFIAHDFDLILMDLQMPVMDGYEATRQIRAIDCPKANIPIIALTAAAMVGEREKCIEAGMNEYLTKPVSYKKLIDTVNYFLAGDKGAKVS